MTRWLVTGAAGMLGRDLTAVAGGHGEVTPAARTDLDLTDRAALADAVRGHDVVVNAAAWTAVDAAEADEAAATAVNGHAVADLARACAATGARLIQISTDYVFDGRRRTPYPENARPRPVNACPTTRPRCTAATSSTLSSTSGTRKPNPSTSAWRMKSSKARCSHTAAPSSTASSKKGFPEHESQRKTYGNDRIPQGTDRRT